MAVQQPRKMAWRIDEVVVATGLGRSTVYKLIRENRLEAIRVSERLLLVSDESLRGLLAGDQPKPKPKRRRIA